MRFEEEDLEKMEKVNTLMKTINDHVVCIYESLMDEEGDRLRSNVRSLLHILRKLQKKHRK